MDTAQGIRVLGESSVRTPVDRVELSIGLEVDRSEPGAAFEAAAVGVTAVLAVLADAGVDSRHVRTADLRLGPRTSYQDGREVVLSYVCGQRLVVILEGLSGVTGLLRDLATTGIEGVRFEGIAFTTADPSEYLARAREHAMADARRKAQDYARLAGRNLGQVLSVEETPAPQWAQPATRSVSATAEMAVAAGESTSSVSVQVVFALL
jgi:uncharacterized protein YggE